MQANYMHTQSRFLSTLRYVHTHQHGPSSLTSRPQTLYFLLHCQRLTNQTLLASHITTNAEHSHAHMSITPLTPLAYTCASFTQAEKLAHDLVACGKVHLALHMKKYHQKDPRASTIDHESEREEHGAMRKEHGAMREEQGKLVMSERE